MRRNVRFWHLADIPTEPLNVRFRGSLWSIRDGMWVLGLWRRWRCPAINRHGGKITKGGCQLVASMFFYGTAQKPVSIAH
jgi:hypothetical protein